MKVLLLGSEGTLGKSLNLYLTSKNIDVIQWDIKLNIVHDLRNKNCIDEILQKVDYVVFLAFDVGGSKYNVYNKEFIDNNMKIILNTFNSLSLINKPFIYTSSCMSDMNTNPYGSLKNISEHYVNLCDNGIIVKLWNVYGNEDICDKSHVIPDFIDSAFNQQCINILTDGVDQRQFLYCDDFSSAIYTIMLRHRDFVEWITNNPLNTIDISSYMWTTIYDLAVTVKHVFKTEYGIDINIAKGYGNDNHTNKTEPTKSLLNDYWKPNISLRDGIKSLVLNYKTKND